MTNPSVLEKMMNSPKIKSLGLREESVLSIIEAYESAALETILENGHSDLGNGAILEVVPLIDRVHVLRGVAYRANRKYKLKITLGDDLYEKIEKYYDQLREDIL